MAIPLKQSTASQKIPLGYFVDSTDGNTEETGLTIANTDIKLWKAGATTLANKNSGGATHISNGVYYAVLDATDTDTLGPLVVFCHVSGALWVRQDCVVLAAKVYDSLIAASDNLEVDAIQIAGAAVSATSAQIGVNVVQISADATAADNLEAALDGTGNVTITANVTGDITGNLSGSVGSVTGAVGSVTGNVGGNVAGSVGSVTGAVGSVTGNVGGNVAGSVGSVTAGVTVTTNNDKTGYSLVSGPLDAAGVRAAIGLAAANLDTQLNGLPSAVADAVWDEATSGHVTPGTTGKALTDAGAAGVPPTPEEVAEAVVAEAAFKKILAMASGKVTKSGDAYTFYAEDNTTPLFTLTYTDTNRTVS